jgi:hypothetical protein
MVRVLVLLTLMPEAGIRDAVIALAGDLVRWPRTFTGWADMPW